MFYPQGVECQVHENFPESLSQAILAGIISTGRLGVSRWGGKAGRRGGGEAGREREAGSQEGGKAGRQGSG